MTQSDASRTIERRGSNPRRSIALVLAWCLGAVAVDQGAKAAALTWLEPGDPHQLVGSLLQLQLVFNPGAAFSFGTDHTWVFTLLALSVTCAGIWYARRATSWPVQLFMGLFLGGVVGNLGDRLFRAPGFGCGYVVDFIQVRGFAVLNLADVFLTVSVIGLVAIMLFAPGLFEDEHEHAK